MSGSAITRGQGIKIFVKLTRFDDGKPLYINTESIVTIYESRKIDASINAYSDMTCVYVGSVVYEVKESAKSVLDLIYEAERNAFIEF